jgi:predicted PurR-regulated permease PerM
MDARDQAERQEAAQTAAEDAGLEPPPVETMPKTVVPKWVQAVVLPLLIVGFVALAVAAGSILLIVLIAAVVAMILNPLSRLLQRVLPRGLAIFGAYVVIVVIVAGIGALLSSPISTQVNRFANRLPSIIHEANGELLSVQTWLHHHGIKIQIVHQGQSALQTLEKQVSKSSSSIVSFSRDLLSELVTLSVDAVLVLVLSVYMLVYGREIGRLVRTIMPPGNGTPEDDFPTLALRAVSGYVRGQLLFTLIMGASATLGLWLLGVAGVFPDGQRYAVFFGAFYGLAELIPYFGPILGAIPPILVALFTDPISALWVAIFFLVLQQLEGHLVAPQVFRISLRINPILVILALLIGDQLYGVPGALIALPLATVLRQFVLYLRAHLVLEAWNTVAPPGVAYRPPPGEAASPPSAGAPAVSEFEEVTVYHDAE